MQIKLHALSGLSEQGGVHWYPLMLGQSIPVLKSSHALKNAALTESSGPGYDYRNCFYRVWKDLMR